MTTVLLVEDDPINTLVFTKILKKRGGLTVIHTEDVEEVLRLTASGEVDLVLMDVSLSNSLYKGKAVDGIRITQMLKENPQTANLPILLVTAHVMDGDREFLLSQSGADGYIAKPVTDQDAFVQEVRSRISAQS